MTHTDIKPGLKVRVIRNQAGGHKPDFSRSLIAGDIIELAGKYVYYANWIPPQTVVTYRMQTGTDYVFLEDIELIEKEQHDCYCPPENFRFNGIGCQCGGK